MKTKDLVLNLLKENGNQYISGQEIADKLFLTRAGVWKAVKALKADGYSIEAVNNRGYCLVTDTEVLSSELIGKFIYPDRVTKDSDISAYSDNKITKPDGMRIIALDSVDSTNNEARKYAMDGFDGDMLIVSDHQTSGRGRRGRAFHSPKGTGLYMSFLIHPQVEISKATLITCMAAVSVCRAIKEVAGLDVSIKWVNDIFYNDHKVCGILTEGFTSMEDGSLSYVIVGIGINIYPPRDGFPPEISKIAGALFKSEAEASDIKNRLCAAVAKHFIGILESDSNEYINEYKDRSNLTGHYVKIMQGDGKTTEKGYALVKGIDDECHLIVQYDDGSEELLSTGEVSVVKY